MKQVVSTEKVRREKAQGT